jgi:hypothetical protein
VEEFLPEKMQTGIEGYLLTQFQIAIRFLKDLQIQSTYGKIIKMIILNIFIVKKEPRKYQAASKRSPQEEKEPESKYQIEPKSDIEAETTTISTATQTSAPIAISTSSQTDEGMHYIDLTNHHFRQL